MMNSQTLTSLKRNAAYWVRRFSELEKLTNHDSQVYIERLKKFFSEAYKAIDSKLFDFFKQFADIEESSMAEAARLLNSEELEAFHMSVEEYIRLGEEMSVKFSPEIERQLIEASLKYRVTRLEAVQMEMTGEVAKLMSRESAVLYNAIAEAYVDRYYRSVFEVFRGYGVGTTFSLINTNELERVLDQPWAADGRNFSSRVWKNASELVRNLTDLLSQAIVRGEGYTETTEKLAKRMNTSFSNAARTVVTERAALASQAQNDMYDELGVDEYQIVAVLDNRTSVICQDLDGKRYKVSEMRVGATAPPFHVNCRTTTRPIFDDENLPGYIQGTRAARDPGGKTYIVPSNMTYKQWAKKYNIDTVYKQKRVI